MFDYHVHSDFSVDCATPMAASCRAAIAAGVTEIAFTDHIDHEPLDEGYGYFRADDYFRAIEAVRTEFGDRLTVLAGAELDFNERIADRVERFLGQYRFDVVIGSVHYAADGPLYSIFADGRGLDDVFWPYLDQVERAVETGWFDTIGHLDLPKRYAPRRHAAYDPLAYRDRLEPIFAAMIRQGVAFEINTSGLRQGPRASMPGPAVVAWYVAAGGALITTGSDSHVAHTIGAGLPPTLDMLELCGIGSLSAFSARRRRQVPIERLRRPATSAADAG